ncbi:MAG TPA: alpha-ketoglutarate-dependent dioxygenase AlkB [Candidatus Dormibacteraeota bacterium]|nr:alpha-ketoglutarate-dependent dioxygenase AlkB [Candidatus Dormibacteraeota bacterium]
MPDRREPLAAAWQPSLFGAAGARPGARSGRVDTGFTGAVRHRLDESAWIDECRDWVAAPDELFEELAATLAWEAPERVMYGRLLPQPRLTVEPDVATLPAALAEMRAALGARYGREFDSCRVNLYRDGRDSVSWHADQIARTVVDPFVAVVSLGAARRFLLRPRDGRTGLRLEPRSGDLLVMGGSSQRTWEHSVPKAARAGPRMSVTFRHSR